jgi:hypothetical protein
MVRAGEVGGIAEMAQETPSVADKSGLGTRRDIPALWIKVEVDGMVD